MSNRALMISGAAITSMILFASFLSSNRVPAVQKVKADQTQINITMNPKTGTLIGNSQTVSIIVQPSEITNTISGLTMTLNASGILKILDVSKPATFPGGDTKIFSEITKKISADRAQLSYVVSLPDDQLPKAVKIDVVVTGGGSGVGSLTIDKNSLQIVGHIPGYKYSYQTVDSAQFTSMASGGNTKSLTLKVRFQGVNTTPLTHNSTVVIKASLTHVNGHVYEYEVPVIPIGSGVWMGGVPIDAPDSAGYTLRIKGALHIQKKVSTTVTIENKENTVDLSTITLFAGDIQGQGRNQDGVIDSLDVAYIRNHFGNANPQTLKSADLNFDGVIDTQDYSLLISSLEQSRKDE